MEDAAAVFDDDSSSAVEVWSGSFVTVDLERPAARTMCTVPASGELTGWRIDGPVDGVERTALDQRDGE